MRTSLNINNIFRKRTVVIRRLSNHRKKKESSEKNISEITNQGQLILDATCASADISYPNDLGILDRARKKSEQIIDSLYETNQEKSGPKPRTYRNIAKKDYLLVAKCRRPSRKKRRKGIRKQLQYLKRNLSHIDHLIERGALLESLSKKQYKNLLVITEIYRQQSCMYSEKKQRVDDRIVNLSQPHIRPIVRGKAGKSVEFGAKLSVIALRKYVRTLSESSIDTFSYCFKCF